MDKLKENLKTDELQHVLKYVLIFFIYFIVFYTSPPVSALEWLFFNQRCVTGLHEVHALPALKLCKKFA